MNGLIFTLGVFALILVLARFKVPLALAILIGAVVEAVLFGLTPGQILLTARAGAVQPTTVALVVITVLLLSLSLLLRVTGQFDQIVTTAKQLLRRPAFTMAALPALIGLLPMPGGALFSAPMVQSAAQQQEVRGNVLSAINYWYRHIWEHWWPLYPGVILAITLTGFSYGSFFLFQFPLGLFMVGSGLLLFRRTHPDLHVTGRPKLPHLKRKFLKAISPIWIILLVWVLAKYLIEATLIHSVPGRLEAVVDKYLPLTAGLLAGLLWTVYLKKPDRKTITDIFRGSSIYSMAALVVSVMVFQYVLKEIEAANKIAGELLNLKVPLVIVVAALPFIAGMVTGLAIGFVGTSFPIVLALVATRPDQPVYPYIALAYGLGHIGQMISPLHLCHVMSNQYFETGFHAVYRRLMPTLAINGSLICGYFLLLKYCS